ncbi:hypothetical protein EIN_262660 [Entamoeba invadens IP1]|uniref:Uncharacterized protein n=1 Tax=Entamoeba invadens IP1 TaxID=370355 RepID=A0A0A1TW57_ENTIV|nr:hypothetical protein EIN_262660 [Entamoeba invadens IP1]ELP84769.1 hypothetical protein EIN_262660 [Entamoeba invadens IP1]|eukprot:XP_004184115.1 hypothetical protein EIN_262660 [Entamoeba invadens IP1]
MENPDYFAQGTENTVLEMFTYENELLPYFEIILKKRSLSAEFLIEMAEMIDRRYNLDDQSRSFGKYFDDVYSSIDILIGKLYENAQTRKDMLEQLKLDPNFFEEKRRIFGELIKVVGIEQNVLIIRTNKKLGQFSERCSHISITLRDGQERIQQIRLPSPRRRISYSWCPI